MINIFSMECNLADIAVRVMLEKGLEPDYSPEVLQEVGSLKGIPPFKGEDLRSWQWCSIDNEDSRDLDQLTYAEGNTLHIAIADVTEIVAKGSPIDRHAKTNTTTVYTPDKIFSMLPERLSTDLTSLGENEDRQAVVISVELGDDGMIASSSIRQAFVRNHAKLTYHKVGEWLKNGGEFSYPELDSTLRLQNDLAQKLKRHRQKMGALSFDVRAAKPEIADHKVLGLTVEEVNLANELIANFMIAANETVARFLKGHRLPSLRRVVKTPKRWDKIVSVAAELGYTLPDGPDPKALDNFLVERQKSNPETFPDLSLTVIKLLGSGEYAVEDPDGAPIGHFGLAIREYTHSTAPNRRYPDIITQRQIKAVLEKKENPYGSGELSLLAEHCTRQEDQAAKVERQMLKSAAACYLFDKIGERYPGIVTGNTDKGIWVRILTPPVEGKVVAGVKDLDVGDKVEAQLLSVDIERGFIDFKVISKK